MKRLMMIAALTALAGCTGHFYSIRGDVLTLYVKKTEARSVYFAHSLDDFKLHPARKAADGTWEISLPAEKEFKYFYIADGRLFIPDCRFTEPDDFGSKNCIFIPEL